MDKFKNLTSLIMNMRSVLVAYSGGVDSTLLLKVAQDVLSDEGGNALRLGSGQAHSRLHQNRLLAVIASSPTYPDHEIEAATKMCEALKVNFLKIETNEFEDENFIKNPKERCYFCKQELFSTLLKIAKQHNLDYVIDGSNADDLHDFRPGALAKQELGVRSPLQEAGYTKEEIRKVSKELGLPTWDKPSYACLSSRIPYGTRITVELLKRIGEGEDYLMELGFKQVRVRDHGAIARIEVDPASIEKLLDEDLRNEIAKKFQALGYTYITLDLRGYRTGSMNDIIRS